MVREPSRTRQGRLVVVGVHAPPINPSGDEWPHYFRETEHSTADAYETDGYLMRRDRKAFLPKDASGNPLTHRRFTRTGCAPAHPTSSKAVSVICSTTASPEAVQRPSLRCVSGRARPQT